MSNRENSNETICNWYRGNMHMHSFWSDGLHFPEMAAVQFKDAGYDFIAFTEHDRFQVGDYWLPLSKPAPEGGLLRDSERLRAYRARFGDDWVQCGTHEGEECVRLRPLSEYRGLLEAPEQFLIVNGEEVSTDTKASRHWVSVLNAPRAVSRLNIDGSASAGFSAVVSRAQAMEAEAGRPVLASLNHPNFRWNANADDIDGAADLTFFEIFTALDSTKSYGDAEHPAAERLWDIVLSRRLQRPGGKPVYGMISDDCHFYQEGTTLPADHIAELPFRAWMMVKAPALTPDALMMALRQGDSYGSSGVMLDALDIDDKGIHLRIQSEPGVTYRTRFIGTRGGADATIGEVLAEASGTEASYNFSGDELYVRAAIESDQPHHLPTVPGDVTRAWTQPVILR